MNTSLCLLLYNKTLDNFVVTYQNVRDKTSYVCERLMPLFRSTYRYMYKVVSVTSLYLIYKSLVGLTASSLSKVSETQMSRKTRKGVYM
jgi:hypothetical protein